MSFALSRTFRALRHRNFRLFFIGQGLSVMGTWLQQVAMGWLTYRISGSVWLLGVVAFCTNAGILALCTFAGVVADHVHPRKALRITQSLSLLQALVLAVLTWSGHIAVWHLVVLALWLGIVHAFDVPLRQRLWVNLVEDRADLSNVVALNSMLVNSARIIGPALAGVLLAVVSEAVCFALNALSFLAVIVAIARMRWKHEPGPVRSEGSFWAKWVEGYRYVSGFLPARAMLLLLGVLSWTISPYSSLMPFYAKDVYGGSPQVLGFLLAAAGAGALASTIYLASRVTIRGLGRVIALAGVGSGVALAAFGYLAFLPGALALMFVVGGGTVLAAASVNTILHSIVPDALRGRVAGFFMLAFLGMAPLGNLAAGALGSAIGVPATFVLNGAVAAVAALWFWRALPKWRQLIRPTYVRLGIIANES